MSQEKPDCFAFLTVRFNETVGYFGGLLSINRLGRPVEFHCSLPIKPSRAQVILYGETLDDFLVGEQISYAIVGKVRNTPKIIFTDLMSVLPLRRLCSIPVACIATDKESSASSASTGMQYPASLLHDETVRVQLGNAALLILREFEKDQQVLQDVWNISLPQFNLKEPFERIVEALREANPIAKAA